MSVLAYNNANPYYILFIICRSYYIPIKGKVTLQWTWLFVVNNAQKWIFCHGLSAFSTRSNSVGQVREGALPSSVSKCLIGLMNFFGKKNIFILIFLISTHNVVFPSGVLNQILLLLILSLPSLPTLLRTPSPILSATTHCFLFSFMSHMSYTGFSTPL